MNKVIFQTKEGKAFHVIYIFLILFFLLLIPIGILFSQEEDLLTKMIIIPFSIFFYFVIIPSYRSGSYRITFEDEGISYKNVFKKGYVTYQDIEEIVYVKTRAKTGWNYTVEVRRINGKRLHFSTTFLKNSKERERFKREWRRRTNRKFRHRKGYFLA